MFTVGDESPRKGGFANGLGKEFPDTPAMKCGAKLARNAPPTKYTAKCQGIEAPFGWQPRVAIREPIPARTWKATPSCHLRGLGDSVSAHASLRRSLRRFSASHPRDP